MKYDAAEILKEDLKLPLEVRAVPAESLLESLDETVDEDAESAWESEILLRLKEIDEVTVKLIPWAEARHRIFRK